MKQKIFLNLQSCPHTVNMRVNVMPLNFCWTHRSILQKAGEYVFLPLSKLYKYSQELHHDKHTMNILLNTI